MGNNAPPRGGGGPGCNRWLIDVDGDVGGHDVCSAPEDELVGPEVDALPSGVGGGQQLLAWGQAEGPNLATQPHHLCVPNFSGCLPLCL